MSELTGGGAGGGAAVAAAQDEEPELVLLEVTPEEMTDNHFIVGEFSKGEEGEQLLKASIVSGLLAVPKSEEGGATSHRLLGAEKSIKDFLAAHGIGQGRHSDDVVRGVELRFTPQGMLYNWKALDEGGEETSSQQDDQTGDEAA
jgi:hypothetical protein